MKGWVYMALLALLAFNVAQCAVGRESGTAQRNRLAEQKRAAKHTADSLKALLAQERIAGEKADTVYRVARARVPSPDTIRLTDTVRVAQYIARCEDALSACDTLADSYRQFRLLAAEQHQAAERFTSFLQRDLKALERKATRARLTSRFGVFLGYATQRQADGILRAGPVLGIGVRILP